MTVYTDGLDRGAFGMFLRWGECIIDILEWETGRKAGEFVGRVSSLHPYPQFHPS